MNIHKDRHPYDDIIHLPHHRSAAHPPMSRHDRAAQFSSFAALKGHGEAIRETARLTDQKRELDEYEKEELDNKLQAIAENPGMEVTITYFQPDEKKTGGTYLTVSGQVIKMDLYRQTVVLTGEKAIPVEQICEIESRLFPDV